MKLNKSEPKPKKPGVYLFIQNGKVERRAWPSNFNDEAFREAEIGGRVRFVDETLPRNIVAIVAAKGVSVDSRVALVLTSEVLFEPVIFCATREKEYEYNFYPLTPAQLSTLKKLLSINMQLPPTVRVPINLVTDPAVLASFPKGQKWLELPTGSHNNGP